MATIDQTEFTRFGAGDKSNVLVRIDKRVEIERAIIGLTRKQDSAVAWTIATLVTLLGGAIGMIFALVTQHR